MRFIEGITGAGRRRLEVARAQRLKRTKKAALNGRSADQLTKA